ncbi:MAG: glycosyltransferase family 39 protein [Nevskia sp.]|nr:glycosyltransferase family 39 protein [Nevskia sp.]
MLEWCLLAAVLIRFLYPSFDSPLHHLFSDPARHWDNGRNFLDPSVVGACDPYLYQLWLFALQNLASAHSWVILAGCGLLCAAMPLGWYLALGELLPAAWALAGGILVAVTPSLLGIYAYFMNETLLLAVMGFAFWASLRARRDPSVAWFALACALWLGAMFTRVVALPMALLCLAWALAGSRRRLVKAGIGAALFAVVAVPAGLHAQSRLHFFSPFGNLYFNRLYYESGNRLVHFDFGADGQYEFGSPSFFKATFYPFSQWAGGRSGIAYIRIDVRQGRAAWIAEEARIAGLRTYPRLRDKWDNVLFLCFGQSWPDNDGASFGGRLQIGWRWMWLPLILAVAAGCARRLFRADEWLLPACALPTFFYLAVQGQAVMEARYRKPVEPIVLAAAVVMAYRVAERRRARLPAPPAGA